MSLHAELSPEALEKLKRQRRASSISSLIIAVLVIALVGLLLGLILLPQLVVETPVLVTYQSSAEELPDEPEQVKVKTKVRPPAPSAQMTRAIVSHSVSPVSVPVTDVEVDTPSLDFGTLDFGEGWGDSVGFDEGAVSGFGSVKRVKGTIGGICMTSSRLRTASR